MKITLTKGNQSFYQIDVSTDQSFLDTLKVTVLKQFQKDLTLPGFRQGHVPLNLVEKNIQPHYLTMGLYEELINQSIKTLLNDNKEIQFIGNPYDISQNPGKGGEIIFTYKLDVYPEVVVVSDAWKKIKPDAIDSTVSDSDVQTSYNTLRRQYADYQDADEISMDSVAKISFEIRDKDGNKIDKGSLFLGKEDFEEFPILKKHFLGHKKVDQSEMKYDEKKLPPTLHLKKEKNPDAKPATVHFSIVDIKNVILPEMTDENIKKFFGSDATIKTNDDLIAKIRDVLEEQKYEHALTKVIDAYIDSVAAHITVSVPKTIIEEEFKSRMQSFQKRVGGEEGMRQYLDQMGEDNAKKFVDETKLSAQKSLEKFFIFRKLTELLEITDINRDKKGDAEQKLYQVLTGGSSSASKKVSLKKEKSDSSATDTSTKKTSSQSSTSKKISTKKITKTKSES